MADVFKNLKVVHKFKGSDETKRMNFINGWLTSISGLKMLWNSLNAPKKKIMSFILVGLIKTAWKIYSVLFTKVKAIILILHQLNLYGHLKKCFI